jgi:hypothetical protein
MLGQLRRRVQRCRWAGLGICTRSCCVRDAGEKAVRVAYRTSGRDQCRKVDSEVQLHSSIAVELRDWIIREANGDLLVFEILQSMRLEEFALMAY